VAAELPVLVRLLRSWSTHVFPVSTSDAPGGAVDSDRVLGSEEQRIIRIANRVSPLVDPICAYQEIHYFNGAKAPPLWDSLFKPVRHNLISQGDCRFAFLTNRVLRSVV